EDGVVVPALVELECISEAAVGALVCGRGLGRSRWDVLLHFERTSRRFPLSKPSLVGHPEVVGEAALHVRREYGVALSTGLNVYTPDGEVGLAGGIGDPLLPRRLDPGARGLAEGDGH